MSFITKIDIDELRLIWNETGRKLGDFKAYQSQLRELSEAYDKMKGIKNKPDFAEVYIKVKEIVDNIEPKRIAIYCKSRIK